MINDLKDMLCVRRSGKMLLQGLLVYVNGGNEGAPGSTDVVWKRKEGKVIEEGEERKRTGSERACR